MAVEPRPAVLHPGYMPGVDVVRGVAILMVLVYHGLAPHIAAIEALEGRQLRGLAGVLELGSLGVQLFFVLSGFLITGILMDSRSSPDFYRNFYLRRALRIVPAYVLMLGFLRATHEISWRFLVVSLLYFCNMPSLFGAQHEYGPLWSLSVEEQFYLFWPVVVRKLDRRQLTKVCLGLLVFTPVLRFGLLYGPVMLRDIEFKTWALLDFFAAGGVLAIAVRTEGVQSKLERAMAVLLGVGLSLFALTLRPYPANVHLKRMVMAVEYEPWLVIAAGLILLAVVRPEVAKGWTARPLLFLAKISYGLYLCHQFFFYKVDALWHLNPAGRMGLLPQLVLRFGAEAALAIGVATASRYTVEEFFLRLKPKHSQAVAGSGVVAEIT